MTELSVVIPCLNEAETLPDCIRAARASIEELGVEGEVVVADNGSDDGSVNVAESSGARVVRVAARGYGAALIGGLTAARGSFLVMGDADGSYDFREVPSLFGKYREGFELVQGCRLPAGGGTVEAGAMPVLHRWVGNPVFSWLARRMFRSPLHDVNCGLRGLTADLFRRLELRCSGMEFAVEMVIKSALIGARTAEHPITLHPDRRTRHAPHQRTYRDGWRTLRYFLLVCPRWLYLIPGGFLVLLGTLGYGLALPGARVFDAELGMHTLLLASMLLLCGYEALLFGLMAKAFAVTQGLIPDSPGLNRFFMIATLERVLVAAGLGIVAGSWMIGVAFARWRAISFGPIYDMNTMRWLIPGVTLFLVSFQTVLSSFLLGFLKLARR